jgi:hypothetical protein
MSKRREPIRIAGWIQRLLSACSRLARIQRALPAMGATALESANCAGTGNGRNTLIKMSTDPIIIIVSGLWIF